MNPRVSIIVPIYNVEKYLSRCLESLINQSLLNIEVIAVNDGSTDQSIEILKQYAMGDKRILIIDKQNGGVSSARNEGLKVAKGEYIGFVDPDDWIDLKMYETMYKVAKKDHAEVVMCTYIREFRSHSKEKKFNHLPCKVNNRGDEVKKILRRLIGPINDEIANPELLDAWGSVWSKIYRADIIKKNDIHFVDLLEIGTNEDSLFNIQVFNHVNSFVFINKPYYHYWRENSTSVTSKYKPKLINQWFNLYQKIESIIKEKNLTNEFYIALNNRICLNTLGLGLNTISRANPSSILMKIKIIHSILNDDRIKRSFKQLKLSQFPIVWRVFYFFAKFRSAVGFYLMLIIIDWLRKTVR